MQITVVYDNESRRGDLRADWGFACIVEEAGRRILFDTGAAGSILLDNMEKLGFSPAEVDEIFISHDHWDHAGGLAEFLRRAGRNIRVYLPASCRISHDRADIVRMGPAREIHPHIFSTGELRAGEQSLVVATARGAAIVAGCSHPGVREILTAAAQYGKPGALIGGLHGFSEFELLAGLELVCATHCTEYKAKIHAMFPEKCIPGGVGTVISW